MTLQGPATLQRALKSSMEFRGLTQHHLFRNTCSIHLDSSGLFKAAVVVDDTGIEPVTPTMSKPTYTCLSVSIGTCNN